LMAAPVGNDLFFAGEHTNRRNPTTTASAMISGYREACNVLSSFGMLFEIDRFYKGDLTNALREADPASAVNWHLQAQWLVPAPGALSIPLPLPPMQPQAETVKLPVAGNAPATVVSAVAPAVARNAAKKSNGRSGRNTESECYNNRGVAS
jgi:hypothetical protein